MKKQAAPENNHPQVEITCPHCGGASTWSLLQTLNQCNYCGSVLSWPYPEGEPDYLLAESVIQSDADLLEVLAMYDAMREASRRRGTMRSPGSDYQPDIYYDLGAGFTDTSVYEIKRERIHLFRILKTLRVHVPYQLISSLLVYHVLGRVSAGTKIFQSLFFQSDAILPGYSQDWNFRDRGLHMSRQKLKSLASEKLGDDFLATGSVTKEIDKITRQWTSQRKIIEAEIQPICFQGKAVESHRWWVYRPYYFVNAQTPQGNAWFLIDGQFGTIAGAPTAMEVNKVIRGQWKKLDLPSVRALDVRVVPFRCTNCGWDMTLQNGIYQICGNCTRVFQVQDDKLELVPYKIIAPDQLSWWPKQHRGPKVWLPFWRVRPSILFEKKTYAFAQIAKALVPAAQETIQQEHVFIPAFDCLSVAEYDRWAFDLGSRLSQNVVSYHETTLHSMKSSKDTVVSPHVSKGLILSLFPEILGMYFPSPVQARLNTLLINRFSEMYVLLKELELVFVPAALLESRGLNPRLQGAIQSIEWLPLKNGQFPPALQRTVRRWKAMGQTERKETSPKSRIKWMTSPFTKRF